MSNPITITVNAETVQAAAAMQSLGATGRESLKQLREGAALTHEGMRGLQGAVMLLGGTQFPALTQGVMTAVMGMRALRTTAMLSKVSLAELVPVFGGIIGAFSLGILAWREWGNETAKATERAKEMADALEKIPGILDKISAAQKAGKLSDSEAGSLQDVLAGRRQMYRKTGSFDPATSQWELTDQARSQITTGRMRGNYRQNEPADSADLVNYAQQALKSSGATMANGKDDATVEATNKLKELMRSVSEEALSGYAKERVAADDKHEKDLTELKDYADKAKLTQQQINEYKAQIDQAYTAKKQQITDKENADLQKSYDAYLREEAATEKQITDELAKQAQLKQEIMRAHVESQLAAIQGNPLLTDTQKAQQAGPYYQQMLQENAQRIQSLQLISEQTTDESARLEAQKQMVDLIKQQSQLQNELVKSQGLNSFGYQFSTMVVQLQNMNNLARESAQLFGNVFNTAITSVSSNLTRVIEGCETMHKALLNIARTLVTDIIQGIIEMGLRWVSTQLMMFLFGRTLQAAATAALIPVATAQAAIWWTPAVLATISSYGGAAAAAPAEVMASLAGFAEGGFTGNGGRYEVAGIVHGGEYVFSAPAVDRIGVGNLDAVHRSYAGGGAVTGGGGSKPTIHNIIVHDRQELMDALKSSDAEHIVVTHVYKNKTRIGIQT